MTVILEKNAYYAAVVLPYLAVGIGVGLSWLSKRRRWVFPVVVAAALWGNIAAWRDRPANASIGGLDRVFRPPPSPISSHWRSTATRLRGIARFSAPSPAPAPRGRNAAWGWPDF
ncbi:MAG: hypothetical protein M5R36_11740 [Deltaproteobacteria bacterium]|nr:hypothetical protein [Deltaproteobacteria bacterium]